MKASFGRSKGFLDYARNDIIAAAGRFFDAAFGLRFATPGLIPATSIVATVPRTDRSFQLTSEPMRFPPLEVIDSSPRFPLRKSHWLFLRALQTPE